MRTISTRLSNVGGLSLDELSRRRGISKTAIIETLLRDAADAKGIPIPSDPASVLTSTRQFVEASMLLADDRYGMEADYDDLEVW